MGRAMSFVDVFEANVSCWMQAEFLQEHSKKGENIITVDSTLFKFNVAKISNSIF